MKDGLSCTVELSVATYERAEELKTLSYDRWVFEDVPSEGNIDGLYLSPDVRYTPQEHDIYIDLNEDLLSQLAQAHI